MMIFLRILDQLLHDIILSKLIIRFSETEIYQILYYLRFFSLPFELLIYLQKFYKRIILWSINVRFNKGI